MYLSCTLFGQAHAASTCVCVLDSSVPAFIIEKFTIIQRNEHFHQRIVILQLFLMLQQQQQQQQKNKKKTKKNRRLQSDIMPCDAKRSVCVHVFTCT